VSAVRRIGAQAVSVLCEEIAATTARRCQQPERWLERSPEGAERRVCQGHGRALERRGWAFVEELHPVPGFERKP